MIASSRSTLFSGTEYIFLDRDGVLNRKLPEGQFVSHWRDFHLLPGAVSALTTLNRTGRHIIVVSNQRGIALGIYTHADVEALHKKLQAHLARQGAHVDAFYYCPHDNDECDCRKPKTGLFERAFRDFPAASTANSIVIGDSVSDMEAAHKLNMPAIFIQGDPEIQKPGADRAAALADAVAGSLVEAVEQYLS